MNPVNLKQNKWCKVILKDLEKRNKELIFSSQGIIAEK
jgi:hypothetical protein